MRRWLIVLGLLAAAGFVYAHGRGGCGGCGHKCHGKQMGQQGGCHRQNAQNCQKNQAKHQNQQQARKQVAHPPKPSTILNAIKEMKRLAGLLQKAANLLGSNDPRLKTVLHKIAVLLAKIQRHFALPQIGATFAVVKKITKRALVVEDAYSFWLGGKGGLLLKGKGAKSIKLRHAKKAVFRVPPKKGLILKGLAEAVKEQLADLEEGDEVIIVWFRLKGNGRFYIASVWKVAPPQQAGKCGNCGSKGGGCRRP